MSLRRLGLLLALPTLVGISLTACGTEDDAAPGPAGGAGATAGAGGSAGNGGSGAEAGTDAEGGTAGAEPGPGDAGSGGAGEGGAGGAAGEGGVGGVSGGTGGNAPVCPTLLNSFDTDPGGAMGKYATPATPSGGPVPPVQNSTVEWSSTAGVTTGAGKLNATFGALGEEAQLSLYFNNLTWTCTTKLRAKVKLLSTTDDISFVNGLAFSINSGPAGGTGERYSSQFTSTATFALDTWYEIELPFATANYQSPSNTLPDFTHVRSIGVMIQTKSVGTTPAPMTLYVDDVWLE